jgi:hypothetical protein
MRRNILTILRVRGFLPSSSSIGSSKRREQLLVAGILFPSLPPDQAGAIFRVAGVALKIIAIVREATGMPLHRQRYQPIGSHGFRHAPASSTTS